MQRQLLIWQANAPLFVALTRFSRLSKMTSTGILFAAIIWRVLGTQLLDSMYLTKMLFGMDLVTGYEKKIAIKSENDFSNYIACTLQMDSPQSLDKLNEHLRANFV